MYTIEVNNKKQYIQPHRLEVFEDTYKLIYTMLYKGHRIPASVKLKDIEKWNDDTIEEIVIIRPLSRVVNYDKEKNTLLITLDNVEKVVSIHLSKQEEE